MLLAKKFKSVLANLEKKSEGDIISNKKNGKGCIFCSRLGSGDFAGNPKDNLIKQFDDITEMMHKKWPNAKYIGYFQAFTNTYAPVEVLKEKYESVMESRYFGRGGIEIVLAGQQLTDDEINDLIRLSYDLTF